MSSEVQQHQAVISWYEMMCVITSHANRRLCVCPCSLCLCIYLSVFLSSVCLSVCQSVCLTVCLSECQGLMQAEVPAIEEVINLYKLLSESDTHLRQPVALEQQLLKEQRMGSEVGKSMLQLLQVTSLLPACTMPWSVPCHSLCPAPVVPCLCLSALLVPEWLCPAFICALLCLSPASAPSVPSPAPAFALPCLILCAALPLSVPCLCPAPFCALLGPCLCLPLPVPCPAFACALPLLCPSCALPHDMPCPVPCLLFYALQCHECTCAYACAWCQQTAQ